MKVASPEISATLYRLSGWSEHHMLWYYDKYVGRRCPKYDVGYLMERLRKEYPTLGPVALHANKQAFAARCLYSTAPRTHNDENPANAVAKLTIALFQLGLLKREGE